VISGRACARQFRRQKIDKCLAACRCKAPRRKHRIQPGGLRRVIGQDHPHLAFFHLRLEHDVGPDSDALPREQRVHQQHAAVGAQVSGQRHRFFARGAALE